MGGNGGLYKLEVHFDFALRQYCYKTFESPAEDGHSNKIC